MAIIRQYHRDTNTTYVYESTYYYDPEKKQSRSKRKLIGKVDPKTGEVVPTSGKRGPKPKKPEEEAIEQTVPRKDFEALEQQNQDLTRALAEKDQEIQELKTEVKTLERTLAEVRKQMDDIRTILDQNQQ